MAIPKVAAANTMSATINVAMLLNPFRFVLNMLRSVRSMPVLGRNLLTLAGKPVSTTCRELQGTAGNNWADNLLCSR